MYNGNEDPVGGRVMSENGYQSAADSRAQEEEREGDSDEDSESQEGIRDSDQTASKYNSSYNGDTDEDESKVRELYLERASQERVKRPRIVPDDQYRIEVGVEPGNFFETKEDEARSFILGMVMAKGSEYNNGMPASQLEAVFNTEVANRLYERDCTLEGLIRSFLSDPVEVDICLRDKENFFKHPMFKDVLSYDQSLGTFKPKYPKNYLAELHKHIQADFERKLSKKQEENRGENEEESLKVQHMLSCNFLMLMIQVIGNDRRLKEISWDHIRQDYEAMFMEDSLCHDIYETYKNLLSLDNYKILNKNTCRELFGRSGAVKFLSCSVFTEKIGYINPMAETESVPGQIHVFLKTNEPYSNKELGEAQAKIEELERKKRQSSKRSQEPATVQASSYQMGWEQRLQEKKAKQEAERLEREKTFVKVEVKVEKELFQPKQPFSFGNFGAKKPAAKSVPEKDKLVFKQSTPIASRSQSPPDNRPQTGNSEIEKRNEKCKGREGENATGESVPAQKATHYFEKTEEEKREWKQRAAEGTKKQREACFTDDEVEPVKDREPRETLTKKKDKSLPRYIAQSSSEEDVPTQKVANIFDQLEKEDDERRGQSEEGTRPAPEETREEKGRRLAAYALESNRYSSGTNSDERNKMDNTRAKSKLVTGPPDLRSRGDPNSLVNHRPQMPNEVNTLHIQQQCEDKEKLRQARDCYEALRKQKQEESQKEKQREQEEKEKAEKERRLEETKATEARRIKEASENMRLTKLANEKAVKEALEVLSRKKAQEEEERLRREVERAQSLDEELNNINRRRQGSGSESGRFPPPEGYQAKAWGVFDQPKPQERQSEFQRDDRQTPSPYQRNDRQGPSDFQWHERRQYQRQEGSGYPERSGFGPGGGKEALPTSIPFGRGFEQPPRRTFEPRDQGQEHFQSRERGGFEHSPTPSSRYSHPDQSFNRQNGGPQNNWPSQPFSPRSPPPRYGNCRDYPDTEYDRRRPMASRRHDSPPGYGGGFAPYRPEPSGSAYQPYDRQDNYSRGGFQNVPRGEAYRQEQEHYRETPVYPQSTTGTFYDEDRASRGGSVCGSDYQSGSQRGGPSSKRSRDRSIFIDFLVLHLEMGKSVSQSTTRWSDIRSVISPAYRNPEVIFERPDWWVAVQEDSDRLSLSCTRTGDVIIALELEE